MLSCPLSPTPFPLCDMLLFNHVKFSITFFFDVDGMSRRISIAEIRLSTFIDTHPVPLPYNNQTKTK
jgi:hypothetical protein